MTNIWFDMSQTKASKVEHMCCTWPNVFRLRVARTGRRPRQSGSKGVRAKGSVPRSLGFYALPLVGPWRISAVLKMSAARNITRFLIFEWKLGEETGCVRKLQLTNRCVVHYRGVFAAFLQWKELRVRHIV